ncbi:Dihydrolipoamide acetyltransferase component of pyruvate dehydrogenase complex [Fusarium falciforme]|uniref:Dihydrolipoamide acetyltransferase component of pyruvate dehydrogenase complex n=1 Tax=Fusarium falciforme TaxID=195108 RepID=UPI00230041AA|nr:Dihydrolipoamide acetyltransferase component of pyruvate dehydrogenase complex [Fusarium falciforme]WAO92388.1 Dihydrolipoamide acetyltransferase component of pyruvate dehydrogenase complex [Fusarium falciforme]
MLRRSVTSLPSRLITHRGILYSAGSLSLPGRFFHTSLTHNVVKPYLLADIGEGITECQIIKWFVKAGDKVQQFDPICEVQSDKASVEITSRYDGTIKKINYEVDDMAAVGAPLMDIEVDDHDDLTANDTKPSSFPIEEVNSAGSVQILEKLDAVTEQIASSSTPDPATQHRSQSESSIPKNCGTMLPSVRHLLKQHNIDLSEVTGTGKGGRVLKEDVQKHLAAKSPSHGSTGIQQTRTTTPPEDVIVPLTPVQNQMYQSMTQSLSIPHFLYTQTVDVTGLTSLRKQFLSNPKALAQLTENRAKKFSPLPFIIKALSQAVTRYPMLNSSLVHETGAKPQLALKRSHNIGIAMDTPKGLVVPVVKNVQGHSIISLAAEIERLSALARDGRLSPDSMKGATMLVSNIGSIGGQVVAPIILSPMVMILAVGRSQKVPAFETGEDGTRQLIEKEQAVFSWSADHRVLDGATVARCAEEMAFWLENANMMGLSLV